MNDYKYAWSSADTFIDNREETTQSTYHNLATGWIMKDSKKVDILIEPDFELSLFGDISADICFKEGSFITQDGDKINTTLNKLFRAKISLKDSGNKITLKIIDDYYGSNEGKEYKLAVIN